MCNQTRREIELNDPYFRETFALFLRDALNVCAISRAPKDSSHYSQLECETLQLIAILDEYLLVHNLTRMQLRLVRDARSSVSAELPLPAETLWFMTRASHAITILKNMVLLSRVKNR